MRKEVVSMLLGAISFLLISCQKELSFEGGNNSNTGIDSSATIEGQYSFVGISGNFTTTITASAAGQEFRIVTSGDFISRNNIGTATISSSQISFARLSYSIDTTMHMTTYLNGVVVNESDNPFITSEPRNDQVVDYVKNNADSITLQNASIVPASGQLPVNTGPLGARINWSRDTLLLNLRIPVDTTISQNGIPARLLGSVSGIMKLKKM